MIRTLLAAAAALAVVSVAQAAPPRDAAWRLAYQQWQPLVEQQTPGGATQPDPALWVVDRTGCVWDADEVTAWQSAGSLDPGASISVSGCLVADWVSHLSLLTSADENLLLTLDVGGITVTGRGTVCVEGPWYDAQAPLPPVPDSNGGVGIPTAITFTVTNTGPKRRVRNAIAAAEIRYSYSTPPTCSLGPRQGAYPGPWWRTSA